MNDINEEMNLIVGKTISKAEKYYDSITLTFDDGSSVEFYAAKDDDNEPTINVSVTAQGSNE